MAEALFHVANANRQGVTLLASGAQTETGAGSAVAGFGQFKAILLQLEVTAAATDAGDTLDVFVQTTIDGSTYIDIAHFTQVLGNGGAKRYIAKVMWDTALTEFETGAALAAAANRAMFGGSLKVRWAITDTGGDDASFTFSVKASGIA